MYKRPKAQTIHHSVNQPSISCRSEALGLKGTIENTVFHLDSHCFRSYCDVFNFPPLVYQKWRPIKPADLWLLCISSLIREPHFYLGCYWVWQSFWQYDLLSDLILASCLKLESFADFQEGVWTVKSVMWLQPLPLHLLPRSLSVEDLLWEHSCHPKVKAGKIRTSVPVPDVLAIRERYTFYKSVNS